MEQVVGGVGSGLFGLHLKGTFISKSLSTPRNWLALDGVVSPGLAKLQLSKHQKYKNKRHD